MTDDRPLSLNQLFLISKADEFAAALAAECRTRGPLEGKIEHKTMVAMRVAALNLRKQIRHAIDTEPKIGGLIGDGGKGAS